MISGKFVTISEFAGRLGVSVQRAHQLIDSYQIPTVPVNARLKLLRETDAKAFERSKRKTAGRPKKTS